MSLSVPLVTIPARAGKAVPLAAGQRLRVINTHGQQVVDTWAFVADDLAECLFYCLHLVCLLTRYI